LFFEDVRPPYIIQDESSFRTEGGFPLGLHGKFHAGVAYSSSTDEYYQTDIFEEDDTPDKTKFNAIVNHIGIENNSLNYKQYATEGAHRLFNAVFVSGQENHYPGSTSEIQGKTETNHHYFQLQGKDLRYYQLSKNIIFGTHIEGLFSNKDLFQNYKASKLSAPGFSPTPHGKSLFIENFHANNYLAGGLKAIYNFSPSMHLRVEAYGFVPIYETIESSELMATKSSDFINNYYLQGMTSLVYQTGIGPISLSLNYYEKQNTNLYLTLNFGYILFNKRGL
jgi:NTE family protein